MEMGALAARIQEQTCVLRSERIRRGSWPGRKSIGTLSWSQISERYTINSKAVLEFAIVDY